MNNKEKEYVTHCSKNALSYPTPNDEIDLKELFSTLWNGKWIISFIGVCFLILGFFYAKFQPNIYESQVLIAPADNNQTSSSALGQLGSLASLAGFSLGNSNAIDPSTLAIEILQSHQFISNFITKHKILVQLMASKGWDKSKGQIIYNSDVYDSKLNAWKKNEKGKSFKPSLYRASSYFLAKILVVEPSSKTGMTTITVDYFSPHEAKLWADWLIEDLNETMRKRDMNEAENSIAYLKSQLEKTNVADTRSMLYQLIQQKTTTLMLTQVRKEYAFQTIDPAVKAEFPVRPKRMLITLVSFIVGVFFGMLVVFTRSFFKDNN